MAWEPRETARWERMARAMVKNAGTNDPEAFSELVRIADWLQGEGLQLAALGLQLQGYSWEQIARPLGVTRITAFNRFRWRARRPRQRSGESTARDCGYLPHDSGVAASRA